MTVNKNVNYNPELKAHTDIVKEYRYLYERLKSHWTTDTTRILYLSDTEVFNLYRDKILAEDEQMMVAMIKELDRRDGKDTLKPRWK